MRTPLFAAPTRGLWNWREHRPSGRGQATSQDGSPGAPSGLLPGLHFLVPTVWTNKTEERGVHFRVKKDPAQGPEPERTWQAWPAVSLPVLCVWRPTRLNKTCVKTPRESHTQTWTLSGHLWVKGRLTAEGPRPGQVQGLEPAGKHSAVHAAHTPSQASSRGGRHPPTSRAGRVDPWG